MGSEPIGMEPPNGASRLSRMMAALRDFGRRRRTPITVVGSVATAAVLLFVLFGRRDEFVAALSGPAMWVLVVTALLQVVALLARSEAWHLSIHGVATAAAVLMTVTGTVGGLCFAAWAGADRL